MNVRKLFFMRRILNISIALCFLALSSMAQVQDSTKYTPTIARTERLTSVYYELFGLGFFFGSVNLDRYVPVSPNMGLVFRIGLGAYGTPFLVGEIDIRAGGPNHSFEAGLGLSPLIGALGEGSQPYLMIRPFGYRFLGNNGVVFRVAPYFFSDGSETMWWPSASLGYAF